MNEDDIQMKINLPNTRKRVWKGIPILLIMIAVTILAAISVDFFSFLEDRLFEERKNHIMELTDKASEIIDEVIQASWQQVSASRYVIKSASITTEKDLMNVLASTSEFINTENTMLLAIDENARYYASDLGTGQWLQTELLTAQAGERQQLVAEIPHKKGVPYFVFMERLEKPVFLQDSGQMITHILIAVDEESLRSKISVNDFDDQCYIYLMNKDGRRLYKHTYENHFIESYNVLESFQKYKIVHGGNHETFAKSLAEGKNSALEFEFRDENGKKQDWFVANAAVSLENWQLLLFVPTKVLGADSRLLMKRTIRFFVIESLVFILLFTVIVVNTIISRTDKRLVRQKDEANQLLMASAEEAKSANRAKSDFLSNMSHDIRTPINGIMGMTEIALKNVGNPDKVLDCLGKIGSSSQHLLGLINDVLDMSRIESGKTKVNHESFDLRVCIDNCTSIIGGQLETRDIEMIREIDTFEHPLLIGDELHLRQVFINILGNSVKFTPDGGKIYFRAQEKESADGKALFQFELEDTGIGMKEEFLPRLFEPFAQEDDGTRTTYKGTGLGMAITKQFLDLMGAETEVESKLNVGTKFTIRLWLDIDNEAKAADVVSNTRVRVKGMKILLVEDIELNLEIAQSILEEHGVIITAAMNGQEAVDAFANHPPDTYDAVLMDIMMPVMDGITATKTIRAMDRPDAKTLPIIAMTANAYDEDIRNTREAGMNAHLSKPIDVDMLLKTISHFYHMKKDSISNDLSGLRVLLAEDVELNREVAQEILQGVGAAVTAVVNGQEAVDAFCSSPAGTFDVILMDVHMPVMDGLTATRTIRSADRTDAKEIPILAMTADVYEEDIQRSKEAGMNGHLKKPLEMERMIYILSGYKGNVRQ